MNSEFIYSAINKQINLAYTAENLNSILCKNNFLYSGEFYSIAEYEQFKYWFIVEYKYKFNTNQIEAEKAFEIFDRKFGFRIREYEYKYDEKDFE